MEKSALRPSRKLPIDFMLDKLKAAFDAKSKDGEINQLRNKARSEVLDKALFAPGNPGCKFFIKRQNPAFFSIRIQV